MTQPGNRSGWKWLSVPVLLAAAVGGAGYVFTRGPSEAAAKSVPGNPPEVSQTSGAIRVEVVRPKVGDMDRITDQPGTVLSYEAAHLYAGVSGYLKAQTVDIGDHVKPGQTLATVDVPELDQQVHRCTASLEQARARVTQMNARVSSARADYDVANATVVHAQANAKSKAAELRFRQRQLDRMKELFALKSIDERLVDEKTEQRDASREAEQAAQAAIVSSTAQVAAAAAKIQQAQADLVEADAQVKVAEADLEKAKVMVRYATVVAPFEGVITHRSLFPGDYVRAATEGSREPLLTVERTDRMRVVVQVPDRDVPFTDPGDTAEVEIDALPGEKLPAKVSRIARSEDAATRLMRVEIDLPNPTGRICQGMYGRVRILLEKSNLLSVPSPSVVDRTNGGKGAVFVVRNGVARKVSVRIGGDNGRKVGILSGLRPDDLVITRPGGDLADGTAVTVAAGS